MHKLTSGQCHQYGRRLGIALLLFMMLPIGTLYGADSVERKTVWLESRDQQKTRIATLFLTPEEQGYRTRIELNDAVFEDQFLSMRPFKCLPHPQQMLCYLPYPYELPRRITDADLTDLEYDLLFLHKTPSSYGIDAWNGFYFELQREAEGFVGKLRETDLNVLAAPPRKGELRPIKRNALYEASDTHWPRRILIE
jgi:hypothetical protein